MNKIFNTKVIFRLFLGLILFSTQIVMAATLYVARSPYTANPNDSTDDTVEIRKCIADANPGDTIFFDYGTNGYKINGSLEIKKKLILDGGEKDNRHVQIEQDNALFPVFKITASNVTVKNFQLKGTGTQTSPGQRYYSAIYALGENRQFISNVDVEDCWIFDWPYAGILYEYVTNFSISYNHIWNVSYAGIATLSGGDGGAWNYINNNNISSIPGTSSLNGYGVFTSRWTSADSVSKKIYVRDNTVNNVMIWEALDTHGGDNIDFINNTITNSARGIAVVDSMGIAPKNCDIIDNNIDAGWKSGFGNTYEGIGVAGVKNSTRATNCTVKNNTVIGYGNPFTTYGAIRVRDTTGLKIWDNTIKDSIYSGILIIFNNIDLNIGRNIFHNTLIGTGRGNRHSIVVLGTNNIRVTPGLSMIWQNNFTNDSADSYYEYPNLTNDITFHSNNIDEKDF
jgi:hypothetical protein